MKKNLRFWNLGFLFVLIFNHIGTFSQVPDTLWTISLGGPGYQDDFLKIISTSDNNYVAAGIYYDEYSLNDIWIIKFNDEGTVIWNNTYIMDTANLWIGEGPRALCEQPDGSIVVLVTTTAYKYYLLFLDSDGNQTETMQILGPDDPYYVYCGINTSDYGFIIAGSYAEYIGNAWYQYSWYRKIDAEGNTVWEHSIPSADMSDNFTSISSLQDGGFILGGSSDTPEGQSDLLFTLINEQGDTIWTRRWGTAIFDIPAEITPTLDGGFIMAGAKTSDGSFYRGFMLKLNSEGQEVWYNTYGSAEEDEIHSVKATPDGGYITTGYRELASLQKPALWVMKTDGLGNHFQSYFLDPIEYGSVGNCIIKTNDNGYIAVGRSENDGLIIKIRPGFGNLGINEELSSLNGKTHLQQNFPNPFSGSTTIRWYSEESAWQSICIYDAVGKEVDMLVNDFLPAGNYEIEFPAVGDIPGKLPNGVYYCRLQIGNKYEVKKMLLLK